MTEQFHRTFDGGAQVLTALMQDGISTGYSRPDIDLHATADSIVAIPFGHIALPYGHGPTVKRWPRGLRATTDLVCRGIAGEWLEAFHD
ncbi:hypothetical protein JDV09_23910 [Mycobacterium sp. Y57]|uniref:hypothetical protein n=1 Tax=Mycolicibacterium xanthum TaxID=2796469 RepID=UPI001C846B25|nr:hypothetical protein [Mycolicibacterium xanthum]MBX7435120.1 hypothetical protein [Mycolicibacterium xanthum]